MIKKIKDKLLFIIPILLILYFILNLLGGNRGLFSYFEKRNHLNNLKNEEKLIRQEIEELEKSNMLLSDNLDTDNNVLTAAIETNDKVRKNRDWESMTGRAVV